MDVTNVSGVAAHVFRGPAVAPLFIRNTPGDGSVLTVLWRAKSSPPSVSDLDGSSWVVAHGSHGAASAAAFAVAPATLTNRAVSAAPFVVAAHDSGGGVTSDWTTQTVTVDVTDTTHGYQTIVNEVRDAGTFVGAAAVSSGAPSGTLTFALPGAQIGDLALVTGFNLGSGAAPGFPAGWTSLFLGSTSAPQPTMVIETKWKILDAADVPSTFVMVSDVMP